MFDKLVADYVNISIIEVQNMNIIEFFYFRREAFIYQMSQTEDGREYLNNAWRLEQTKPDREKLRENFGKEEKYHE